MVWEGYISNNAVVYFKKGESLKLSNLSDEKDKPFNDAVEHLNKIEGYPISKGGNLPLPIKIIGYFMFGGIIITLVFGLFVSIFN